MYARKRTDETTLFVHPVARVDTTDSHGLGRAGQFHLRTTQRILTNLDILGQGNALGAGVAQSV
jgi:hypothetical protein